MHNLLAKVKNSSAGSLRLTLFLARRDWLKSLSWLAGLFFFATAVPWAIQDIYGADGTTLQAMVPMLQNPAMIAMLGPVFDAENYTVGAMLAGEMLLFAVLAVCLMNILFVVRYTRADEEAERAEVIRSLPVGRLAPLNAALIGALILNILVTLLTWGGLVAMNIPTVGATGAFLYAAACGITGMVFAAIAAICSQLASTSRAAIAYSGAVLGILYLVRGAGDLLAAQGHNWGETLSRLSALGLCLRVEAFVSDYFWPLPYLAVQAIVLMAVAYYLNSHRDLGAGIIPPKPGPAHASPLLTSNTGLAWRLLRNTFIGWMYVAVVLGASYGSIMNYIADFVQSSPFFEQALQGAQGYSVTEAFASLIMVVLAAMTAAAPIMLALKAWKEEGENRTELVLATAVSRRSYLLSYAGIAFAGSIIVPALATLGMWGASALVMTNPIAAGFFFEAMVVFLPAIWVFLGLVLLLIAVAPRLAAAVTWIYFTFSFFMAYFGELFTGMIPDWMLSLSVFHLSPNITKDPINWTTLGIVTAIAFAMMIAGIVLYGKRDLQGD